MTVTAQDVRDWCAAEKEGIDRGLEKCTEAPDFLKRRLRFQETWAAGCWLMHVLKEAGCPEEQKHNIGFAHGQRSLFGDPFEVAAAYFNEWSESSETPEEPGLVLAQQIMDEVME